MDDNHALAAARRYRAAGLSVIPVALDGSKAPALAGWREFSERRPGPELLDQWFAGPVRHGIGIPGGPASGHLVVLDFEARAAFDGWAALLSAEERAAVAGSPVVRTPRDGVHVYVRLTDSVKGTKYARTAAGACLIETRGNGHQVVAPGSPPAAHPSGRPYTFARTGWIVGPPTPPVPLDVFHGLTVHAAALNEYSRPAAHEVIGDRRLVGEVRGQRPGDCFNAAASWADVLGRHGWRAYRSAGPVTYWSRPGKEPPGVSASSGHCRGPSGHDLLYVFSSSAAPFEAERSYSRFGAYALLCHGGDFAAATRALGRAGYGAPPRRKGVRA
ncbi:bifunctional DNA primase/polymerase [Gemmata sp.]|uniref:bifunctional DNA primase/polymerase n=1 Tax=Gemmata sp. TaxID=1914242 RepID=UPI003F6F49F9